MQRKCPFASHGPSRRARPVVADLPAALSRGAWRAAAVLFLSALAGLAAEPAAALPLPASGGPELRVSLREAMLMALEHNRSLAVERFTPAIVQTAEDEARAVFDPVIGAAVSASRESSEKLSSASHFEDATEEELALSGSLRRTFATGTTVTGAIDTTVVDASYSDQVTSSGGRVSVTQALLRGRSVAANLARIREARLATASSEHEVRAVIEALAADVEDTYWDLALAERRIAIYTESLKVAEQYLRETRDRIAAGSVAEIELAAAEAEIPLRRQGLITANGTMQISRLRLLRLLNPPGDRLWDRAVSLADVPATPTLALDPVADHVAVALQKRPDLSQARLQVDLQDLEIVRTRDGLLPRLDAFIALGKTGYANAFPESIWHLGHDTYAVSAGLTYEVALGNRDAKANHRHAILSREQADAAVTNLVQLIELDVRTAYVNVTSANEQVAASAATRRLREQTLRAETEKSRVGKSTSFLVAQAQRDLLASQIVEVEAVVHLLHSMTTLYRLESSLLDRRGIVLGEPPQE